MGVRVAWICLSVALFWLGSPGGAAPVLAWAHLLPLAWALRTAGPGDGARAGFIYGFLFILVTDWWISHALVLKAGLGPVAAWGWTFVFCTWHALPYAAAGWCAGLAWRRGARGAWWAVWCAASFTACVFLYPHLFPGNAAHGLYRFPLFLQVLDLGGVPLLLFLLVAASWLVAERMAVRVAERVRPGSARRGAGAALCFAALVGAWAGYGWWRLDTVREAAMAGPRVAVLAVQPDAPVAAPGGEPDHGQELRRVVERVRAVGTLHPDNDLVVLPELPLEVSCSPHSKDMARLGGLARDVGAPLVANCVEPATTPGVWRNAARLVAPGGTDGPVEVGPLYVKRRLVPFGEHVPFADALPWLGRVVPVSRAYEAGREAVVFRTGSGLRVAPLLCHENLFPDEVRDMVDAGAQVLAAMDDDAWFVSPRAALVHLSMVVPRAVEFRRPLVRAGNSGGSAVVAATGDILDGPGGPGAGAAAGRVGVADIGSVYARVGDVFGWSLAALWCCGVLWLLLRPEGPQPANHAGLRPR